MTGAKRIIAAYVFDRDPLAFGDADAAYLTHIIWSFGLVVEGRVTGQQWNQIGKLKAYKERHPHIQTTLAIGGWEADGFSQAAATAEGRKLFVDSALELVREHGFDGIDIDWEYPCSDVAGIAASPEDKPNFTLLIQALREGLDTLPGPHKLLTIAVGASDSLVDNIECAKLSPLLDYVHVMTYDMSSGRRKAAHHTNLYPWAGQQPGEGNSVQQSIAAYAAAGFRKDQLVVGSAWYGRTWQGIHAPDGNPIGKMATNTGNVSYGIAKLRESFIGKNGYIRYWDEQAHAPYLFDGENFISYDDEQSVREKGEYVRKEGLAGMMFWQWGSDPEGKLLAPMREGLDG